MLRIYDISLPSPSGVNRRNVMLDIISATLVIYLYPVPYQKSGDFQISSVSR